MKKELKTRDQVKMEDCWDLTKLFASVDEWDKTCEYIITRLPALEYFEGRLNNTDDVKACLDLVNNISRDMEKISVYAFLKSTEDLSNDAAQQLKTKSVNIQSQFATSGSFINPELSAQKEEFLLECLNHPGFVDYRMTFKQLIRQKPHVLSDKEERLLAQALPLWGSVRDIYQKLESVDIQFPDAADKEGNTHIVTHATFGELLASKDRVLRKNAFLSLYNQFQGLIHTCAATLNSQAKQHYYFAKIRNYKNTLQSSLYYKDIDEGVYYNLIRSAEKHLSTLHRYVDMRRRLLELDEIEMWDLHVSLIPDLDMKFTYDEAVELVLEAVKPLGEDYRSIVKEGLTLLRWVDKYENKSKSTGAFSSGCFDSPPYILMNFNGTLDNVYTLIHEAGHSMHTYFANQNQPYTLHDYTIFTAEIASTVNERLLTDYLLKKYEGKARLYVINREIDGIRTTFFRQTKFADFELKIHESIEQGNTLTVESLCKLYDNLNEKYYGPTMKKNEFTPYEWARIPHFYRNYYVFQYATGIACAYHYAEQILKGNKDSYLALLKSGGNDFPLTQLKKSGVDMHDPKLYEPLFNRFSELLKEFE